MKRKIITILCVVGVFGSLVGCKRADGKTNFADELYKQRTDFIGSSSDSAKLALTIFSFGGNKSGIKLDTDEEPYGIAVYSDKVDYDEDELFKRASLLIGLIENLDYVEVYKDEERLFKTDLEEVNGKLDFDIKEIGQSREKLEEYLEEIKMVNG